VSGSTAGIIFCVFTKGKAGDVSETVNGYLGWHHVNKVDTCISYSSLRSVGIGNQTISWDGKDQDGGTVPPGDYTYYLWAYDNQGSKQKMTHYGTARSYYYEFQEVDEKGLPMANPLYYELEKRWIIGSDPMDSTLIETTTVNFAEGWSRRYTMAMDTRDFDYFFIKVLNNDAGTACISSTNGFPTVMPSSKPISGKRATAKV